MSKGSAAPNLEAAAAAWALRLDEGVSETDPEFLDWLARDNRSRGALLRAQAALNLVDRTAAVFGAVSEPEPLPSPRLSRRGLIAGGGALAAGLAAGGVGLFALRPERFDTQKGEVRRVPLHDGSVVAINTQSTLTVALRKKRREIDLRHGEAWFEVAKDPARPFVVAVGDIRVRAVGTAFSVRRLDGKADVLVTEGVIEAWSPGHAPVRVAAGSKILIDPGSASAPVAAAQEIERQLAWRTGQIVLEGQSLAEAAADFNRYNDRRIVIDAPDLAAQRFVGVFQINDPAGFATAAAASLGARVVERDGALHLRPLS